MKPEEAKNLRNVFKSNLNETLRGRYKSEEEKSGQENIRLFQESREAAIKLFNDYSSIVSVARYTSINEEGLKVLTSKQMFQRLSIALAQVRASKNLKTY